MGGCIRGIAAAIVVAAVFAEVPGRAAVILDSLVVRIYDNAGVLARDRARALDGARDILARAQVAVDWRVCPVRGGACASAPAPGELVVRLVRSPRTEPKSKVLGTALIDSTTGAGTLATVFIDRVVAVAGSDPWPMVGRVMAHELGHLLLGTNAHSDTGLMRELWSAKELTRNRPEDWQFSTAQRTHLQWSILQFRRRS